MPAGALDTGRDVGLGFGRRFAPRETALGAEESGVEKGCGALVEVAAGGFESEDAGAEVVTGRVNERMRNAEARWRQR